MMKKISFLAALGLGFLSAVGLQGQNFIQWEKSTGGSDFDDAQHIFQLSNTEYVVTGSTSSTDGDVTVSYGGVDILVQHLDATGQVLSSYTYGGSGVDYGMRTLYDNNGGFFVLGYTSSSDGTATTNRGVMDVWIISTQTNGNVLWQEVYGGTQADVMYDALMTPQHDIIIAGHSQSADGNLTANYGNWDGWVLSVNKNTGLLNWQVNLGGSLTDKLFALKRTATGDFIVAGYTESADHDLAANNGGADILVAKIDANGNPVWVKNFGGSGSDVAYTVDLDPNGNIYLGGSTTSTDGDFAAVANQGGSDVFVMKLNAAGNFLWAKTYGGSASETLLSLRVDAAASSIYGMGYSLSSDGDLAGNYGASDVWILDMDMSGNLMAQKNFGGTSDDMAHHMIINQSGHLVFTGGSSSVDHDVSTPLGSSDFWTVELNQTLDVAGVGRGVSRIFPNPATDRVSIHSSEAFDRITLTDLSGRTIRDIRLDHQPVTRYELDLGHLPAGRYLVHVRGEKYSETQSLIKR